MPNFYEILRLPTDATVRDILRAAQRLINEWDPSFVEDPKNLKTMFKIQREVLDIRDTLADSEKRKEYDKSIGIIKDDESSDSDSQYYDAQSMGYESEDNLANASSDYFQAGSNLNQQEKLTPSEELETGKKHNWTLEELKSLKSNLGIAELKIELQPKYGSDTKAKIYTTSRVSDPSIDEFHSLENQMKTSKLGIATEFYRDDDHSVSRHGKDLEQDFGPKLVSSEEPNKSQKQLLPTLEPHLHDVASFAEVKLSNNATRSNFQPNIPAKSSVIAKSSESKAYVQTVSCFCCGSEVETAYNFGNDREKLEVIFEGKKKVRVEKSLH